MGVVDEMVRAREAYERRDWMAAYDALSASEPSSLRGDDFARLALSAHLLGRRNDSVQAMQRAFAANLASAEPLAAARCAFWLAITLAQAGEAAVAGGWQSRGVRLLADEPDVVERGYLECPLLFGHIMAGEFEAALECAERVTEYGARFGEADLLAMGLSCQGRLALFAGRVREGLRLMDEAMATVASGECSTVFAGEVYCTMIEGCQEISDFRRATEWTAALTSWCDAQPDLVLFTGQCAVHRAQIMRLRGALDEAVTELGLAIERYELADTPAPAALAHYELGEVFRIRGDVASAVASFRQAGEQGLEPQPGLALLWLGQGRGDAALAAVRRLLDEPRGPVERSRLLPAAVEILLSLGHAEEAAPLVDELTAVSESFGSDALRAQAAMARAGVLVSGGAAAAALGELRQATRLWQSLGAPYEAARCRMRLATVLRELGDADSAAAEAAAARDAFTAVGATADGRASERFMERRSPGGLTGREVEVLRLVAAGRSNAEIAATLVLSDKTVARHLSNIFAKLGVSSRTAAAAYAFENHVL
jgi:ATP/maltotriose-dependent transcriptional regulator MalT